MKFQNLNIFQKSSLNQNGYIQFLNELIIQWGYIQPTNARDVTTNFPISFKNSCFSLTTNNYNGNYYGDDTAVTVKSISKSSFVTYKVDNFGCHWIAIGI